MVNWQTVSASVAGTSHQKRGQPCQDAHYARVLPQGILVAAVADGAGSAAWAEVGAEIAVQVAVGTICKSLELLPPLDDDGWKVCLSNTVVTVQNALETEASSRDVSIRDLAATLILVIATKELVAVVQVGDGAAVVGNQAGETIALTAPCSGEHINETTFLISANALDVAQFQVWHGHPQHLAIFSDGLQMLALKMPEGTPHAPFFTPLFKFVASVNNEDEAKDQLENFLKSPRVTEKADDDLTLFLASLVDGEN